ncbi:hypothetical protein K443DRAFT_14993 [Laccaria amethystina LaAM-08-1]|uniref:Unplaced genomic scaffold K443scaffold_587, whole genome shotgun sequence n=1 Tax=Laccaria amethystina LaAM-08-1 TaxID=1095629 RepID=A0A0C9WH79_9AGAR|nr:hypothetical protein K443DRAFT_14993 [Laccaria amethystina LaAM-08-1]
MISNLDANSARGLIDSTNYQPFNHHPGLFVNKYVFSSTTGTILTMQRGERAADDGDQMSDDERGKFTRRKTGRFSFIHYESATGRQNPWQQTSSKMLHEAPGGNYQTRADDLERLSWSQSVVHEECLRQTLEAMLILS